MESKEGKIDFIKWFSELNKSSINFAGGKALISFAIVNGTSQHTPKIKPSQNKYQIDLSIFFDLYKK